MIEKFISSKSEIIPCFCEIHNEICVALINFFDKDTPVDEIMKYINSYTIILTKTGNLEQFPIRNLNHFQPVMNGRTQQEIKNHYKQKLETYPPDFFFYHPNLYEIINKAQDIYEAQRLYKKEFEKLIRKCLNVSKDKKWLYK